MHLASPTACKKLLSHSLSLSLSLSLNTYMGIGKCCCANNSMFSTTFCPLHQGFLLQPPGARFSCLERYVDQTIDNNLKFVELKMKNKFTQNMNNSTINYNLQLIHNIYKYISPNTIGHQFCFFHVLWSSAATLCWLLYRLWPIPPYYFLFIFQDRMKQRLLDHCQMVWTVDVYICPAHQILI